MADSLVSFAVFNQSEHVFTDLTFTHNNYSKKKLLITILRMRTKLV